jgi:hypothetical protein
MMARRDLQKKALATLKGGRGECRVSGAPVVRAKMPGVVATGSPGSSRHSLRDGVTVSFVLSPVTGLFVTVVTRT